MCKPDFKLFLPLLKKCSQPCCKDDKCFLYTYYSQTFFEKILSGILF